MTTITLTLDDTAARQAGQVARRRRVSLEDLLRDCISRLAHEQAVVGSSQREAAVKTLRDSFANYSRPFGGKGYTSRDELYDRPSLH
jgi:hypothetical protein